MKGFLVAIAIFFGSGFLSYQIADGMASSGALGTCREGACGYEGLFIVFPCLWLGSLVASLIVFIVYRVIKGRIDNTAVKAE
jgi:hypothetical protein